MKTWQLTGPKEYKLYVTDSLDSTTDTCADMTNKAMLAAKTPRIKVKMVKANLSPTDTSCYLSKGTFKLPITPARSAVAMVSESSLSAYEVGRKVFLSPYTTDSKGGLITRSYDADGYLSDFAIVNASEVYSIPDGLTDNEILFIEDIALCITCLSKLHIEKGQYIALYGASYLNCILAQLAIYYQTIPIIIDNDEDRLSVANNLGVYYTINTRRDNAVRKTIEITSGKMIDMLVIDADTFPSLDESMPLIKKEGTVGIYGYSKAGIDMNSNLDAILQKGLNVVGINNGHSEIPSAINLLANKVFNFEGLIENEVPFSNFVQIIKHITDKTNEYKNIVTFI